MKFLVAVTLIVLLTDGAQSYFKEQFDYCKEKVGVTSEELLALKNGEYGDDTKENIKCLTKCVFDEMDFMKDEALKEDVIRQKLQGPIGEENLNKIFDNCRGLVGETKCDTAFKIFTCVMQYRELFDHDREHKHGQ